MSTKSEQQQQLAKRNTIITKQIVLTSPVYAVDIQYWPYYDVASQVSRNANSTLCGRNTDQTISCCGYAYVSVVLPFLRTNSSEWNFLKSNLGMYKRAQFKFVKFWKSKI